jgi:hypothetical protein
MNVKRAQFCFFNSAVSKLVLEESIIKALKRLLQKDWKFQMLLCLILSKARNKRATADKIQLELKSSRKTLSNSSICSTSKPLLGLSSRRYLRCDRIYG